VDITEFKKQYVKNELQINESYGRVLAIIDFGNVNYWFESDRQDSENKALADYEKLKIDLQGLKDFSSIFSQDVRFYYGSDRNKPGSVNFITVVKNIFGRSRVFSKQIQYIRHYLNTEEVVTNTRMLFKDGERNYVKLPKCNFDVEMTVDVIRLMNSYDTLAMFSSDADFIALFRHLRNSGKKVILIKGGNITSDLRNNCELVVNAQNIKKHITQVEKQKPGV
jgi:uncharacterized LabA/DUF88 family protein